MSTEHIEIKTDNINNNLSDTLIFYAIINHENKFFRNKGYGGYRNSWVDNINKARIYPKIGTAKSQITYWAINYPQFPIPKLVEIIGNVNKIIDQTTRINDVIIKQKERKHKQELNDAKTEYEKAKHRYNSLK